jgi:hypothetical protein
MSKKISRAVLLPIIGLLSFTQGIAARPGSSSHQPLNHPVQVENTSARSMVIQGKMFSPDTIQIKTADIPSADAVNSLRVITLMDVNGEKQRFILLPPDRTQWIHLLQQYNGSIKEFYFYKIVDENGRKTNLLASKRILEAPANQLTVVFPTMQDARNFFTLARQQQLEQAGFLKADNAELQAINSQEAQESESYQNQINKLNQQIEINMQDTSKSSMIEPVTLFAVKSVMIATIILETPITVPTPPKQ